MKRITSLQYSHTFHWAIPITLLFEFHYDELEHHSSQIMSMWILSYSLCKFFWGIIKI
jgi:hypothetical protein